MDSPESVARADYGVNQVTEANQSMVGDDLDGLHIGIEADFRNGRRLEFDVGDSLDAVLHRFRIEGPKRGESGKVICVVGTVAMADVRFVAWQVLSKKWVACKKSTGFYDLPVEAMFAVVASLGIESADKSPGGVLKAHDSLSIEQLKETKKVCD